MAEVMIFDIGDLTKYVAGSAIPEGDYALEFIACMEPSSEKYTPKVPRVGIQIVAHPLDGEGEPKHKFLALGGKVHESLMPNPDTGKSFVVNPNGKALNTLPQSSNWAYFLKSLYDSGLDTGVFVGDLSVLDGVHVHISSMPEPEERKSFRAKPAKTSEVEVGEDTGPKGGSSIPIVTEIKDDGKPWEGTGGIPEKAAPKPVVKAGVKTAVKAAVKPAVKAAAKVIAKPAAAPAAAVELTEEEIHDAALEAFTTVLEKNPDGCQRLVARTGAYAAAKKAHGEDMANAIVNTYFADDDKLNEISGELGFVLDGNKLVVAA